MDLALSLVGTAALVLALLALRRLPAAGGPGLRPWDGGVALVLGVGVALLCLLHLAPFHLAGGLLADDFEQYCATVGALREGLAGATPGEVSRAAPPLLPAALAARALGIIDGLLLGSVAAVALLAAVLYLWATLLHGRVAGTAAALLVAGVGPLVLATRTLTSYPALAAGYALAAFLASAAVARPGPVPLLLAGLGAGLATALDQFGVAWGLACLAVALAAASRGPGPAARRGLGLAAVVLGLGLTWIGARALPPPWMPMQGKLLVETLDVRLAHHLGWHLSNTGSAPLRDQPTGDNPTTQAHVDRLTAWQDGHLWGHSPPWAIARTVGRVAPLALAGMAVPGASLREGHSVADLGARVTRPWWLAMPLLAVGAGLALRRRPRDLAALAVLVLPFLGWLVLARSLAVQRADAGHLAALLRLAPVLGLPDTDGTLLIVKPKFFMPAVVPLPLLGGLAVGWLAQGAAGLAAAPSWRGSLRPLLAGAALLLALVGALPTLLSPTAPWQWIHPGETEQLQRALDSVAEPALPAGPLRTPAEACRARLLEDAPLGPPRTLRWCAACR